MARPSWTKRQKAKLAWWLRGKWILPHWLLNITYKWMIEGETK